LKLAFSHTSLFLSFRFHRTSPAGSGYIGGKQKARFSTGFFSEGGEGGDPFDGRLPGGDRLFLGLLLFAFIGFLFSLALSNELMIGIAPTVPTGKISYKTL
jgi:hypothetical protein